ncbi:MAG: response regulator transcription factor [Saprospiraceae bacterium]|nr:response regulator transcription factor [Saprospiraceae bacterium]
MVDYKVKIVIADDHEVVIDGLVALLAPESDIQVVGKALDGEKLLEVLRNKPVDLVIMDIEMPNMNGAEATAELKASRPDLKILVLTMYNTAEFIGNLAKLGADGYILKNSPRKVLLEAIREVAKGGKYFPLEIKEKLFDGLLAKPGSTDSKPVELTDRELEIVRLICNEMTSQEIADQLYLSFHTVEKHRKNIIAKLQVKNTAGLVRYAFRNKLVE